MVNKEWQGCRNGGRATPQDAPDSRITVLEEFAEFDEEEDRAKNKMTKQSVRVVSRPPSVLNRPPSAVPRPPSVVPPGASRSVSSLPASSFGVLPNHDTGVHCVPDAGGFTGKTFSELVELAEQQRLQIEANRREEQRRDKMMLRGGKGELTLRVHCLRREVAEEEQELKRLTELERETRTLRARSGETNKELEMLTRTVEQEQAQLRLAAAKVDTLRHKLDELHRRRRAAATAAIIEQKRMQTAQAHMAARTSSEGGSLPGRAFSHSLPPTTPPPENVVRPRASVEPFQIQNAKTSHESTSSKTDLKGTDHPGMRSEPSHPPTPSSSMASTVTAAKPSLFSSVPPGISSVTAASSIVQTSVTSTSTAVITSSATREDASPSPPKDPHPSAEAAVSTVEEVSVGHARFRGGRTDLVSLRSDSLKATKRRSWATSEGATFSECDVIRRILEEQSKGRSHFLPDLMMPEATKEDNQNEAESSKKEANENTEEDRVSLERPRALPSIGDAKAQREETSSADEESSLCSARSEDAPVMEMEYSPKKSSVKGILRTCDTPSKGRRIQFDPLALLLDAALEGEIDLVRSSASKLEDVSASNDEGITALHNAICAGHYEIVRFLIEEHADVNAQDSDGWTPLHCAASCNNLPMVRILVEGGACVLAATLSDNETPVDKCEEEEEGFDGCQRYLSTAHNATGTLNNGTVYAAYGYKAEREDELSFEGGDQLRVLDKEEKEERGWWKCERQVAEGVVETGLAPRTFLALYPPRKYRKQNGFVPFDLEANNNDEEK